MTKLELIKNNTGLIYKIMNDSFYGIDRDDLFQAGVVGLLSAYKNYQVDGNVKFSTYAYKYIFGEMYNLAMQKQIKISKDYLKLYKEIEKTRYALAQKYGFIPNNKQIALFLERDINEIEQAVIAGSIIVNSLDKSTDEERSIYETIPKEENISLEESMLLKEGLDQLTEEERKIIIYRYYNDYTQSEVARKLNKKQVTISRYENKSIEKIREYFNVA